MDEKIAVHHLTSLMLCDKLSVEINTNQDDANSFFGGDMYKAYVKANDTAMDKVAQIKNKLRSLNI